MKRNWREILVKRDDYRWEIPQSYRSGMRVPGLIYANEKLLEQMGEEEVYEQVANVAYLPGIVRYSLAMPDIHWGYGFPIGGVAATRLTEGVISPGGVGFDINCGVRLLWTDLLVTDISSRLEKLIEALFYAIPSGLGSTGRIKVSPKELDQVLARGAHWIVAQGMGESEDLTLCEEEGCLRQADPGKVSDKAKKRGAPQLGTLGSGNHFLEIGVVDEIYEPTTAKVMGINSVGQILIWIHTGSRGLGHQVCTEYLQSLAQASSKYQIELPDRQLACAPVNSKEGQDYLAAMASAANFAWANRQCITHWAREAFGQVLGSSTRVNIRPVYDVAHNIAKIEEHKLDKTERLCVHRKGATRSFPPGHPQIPLQYRGIGQPVLIPGDMGRYSFVAVGTATAMKDSFGSTCHGAGRVQSRAAAKKGLRGTDVARQLAEEGILVKAGSLGGLAEEASIAYKDVREVAEVTHHAGLSRLVAKTRPLGVIKG